MDGMRREGMRWDNIMPPQSDLHVSAPLDPPDCPKQMLTTEAFICCMIEGRGCSWPSPGIFAVARGPIPIIASYAACSKSRRLFLIIIRKFAFSALSSRT